MITQILHDRLTVPGLLFGLRQIIEIRNQLGADFKLLKEGGILVHIQVAEVGRFLQFADFRKGQAFTRFK